MKPPVLHIMSGGDWLCGLIEDGSNWPEEYMDDDVARFLEFCKGCEVEYIKKYGEEKFIEKKNWMRRDKSKDSGFCNCGCHPDQNSKDYNKRVEDIKIEEKVMTLRMYLESY